MLPRRRNRGLLLERANDETIVYDSTRHVAHCLNRVSSLVWQHCDGQTSPAGMVKFLHAELGLAADEATVELILEQLAESNLLVEERPARSASAARRSRRQVARQLAAIGLSGVVMSIVVPTAAAAGGSGVADGGHCTNSSECQSGCCCQSNTNDFKDTCRANGDVCGGAGCM